MHTFTVRALGALTFLAAAGPAVGQTATIQASGSAPYELSSTVWLLGKLDGVGKYMNFSVNGIPGGNSTVGTVNSQNGEYRAPAVMPPNGLVTITATTVGDPQYSGTMVLTLKAATPAIKSITPKDLVCGQPFKLTLTGLRYDNTSTVYINSKPAPTTFVSDTQLTATGTINRSGVIGVKVVSQMIGASSENWSVRVGSCTATSPTPAPTPAPTHAPTPAPTPAPSPEPTPTLTPQPPIGQQPAPDAQQIAATRLLEHASFGPTAASIAKVRSMGVQAWIAEQLSMPASPINATNDMNALRRNWYMNMATGPDQLRQRMIFALSQIWVVSYDKNPYANEMKPWLDTLDRHAFGNYRALMREMTLNPAMGKYLDLGNSIMPSPNENYARELMQLFTIGPVMLNQDGSVQKDMHGEPIPTYNQERIGDFSRALSGWTYTGDRPTGINWENFSGPLQPRDNYHHMGAKTLLNGVVTPAGQGAVADLEAVLDNLFHHPNLPPFVATRLIRHFVTSNPSPDYIRRVADVFANSANGRGDLAATLVAVLTDPEARSDAVTADSGHLKDPMLHTLTLVRALDAQIFDMTNMFWDYTLQGQKIMNSPSVFNFYSPLTRLPGQPTKFGPEFQIYAPSMAIGRANFIYRLLSGEYNGMIRFDISPYVNVAGDPTALINLVDAKLLQGRMSPATRNALAATIVKTADMRQRALTALYLTAISAEFAVSK